MHHAQLSAVLAQAKPVAAISYACPLQVGMMYKESAATQRPTPQQPHGKPAPPGGALPRAANFAALPLPGDATPATPPPPPPGSPPMTINLLDDDTPARGPPLPRTPAPPLPPGSPPISLLDDSPPPFPRAKQPRGGRPAATGRQAEAPAQPQAQKAVRQQASVVSMHSAAAVQRGSRLGAGGSAGEKPPQPSKAGSAAGKRPAAAAPAAAAAAASARSAALLQAAEVPLPGFVGTQQSFAGEWRGAAQPKAAPSIQPPLPSAQQAGVSSQIGRSTAAVSAKPAMMMDRYASAAAECHASETPAQHPAKVPQQPAKAAAPQPGKPAVPSMPATPSQRKAAQRQRGAEDGVFLDAAEDGELLLSSASVAAARRSVSSGLKPAAPQPQKARKPSSPASQQHPPQRQQQQRRPAGATTVAQPTQQPAPSRPAVEQQRQYSGGRLGSASPPLAASWLAAPAPLPGLPPAWIQNFLPPPGGWPAQQHFSTVPPPRPPPGAPPGPHPHHMAAQFPRFFPRGAQGAPSQAESNKHSPRWCQMSEAAVLRLLETQEKIPGCASASGRQQLTCMCPFSSPQLRRSSMLDGTTPGSPAGRRAANSRRTGTCIAPRPPRGSCGGSRPRVGTAAAPQAARMAARWRCTTTPRSGPKP